MQPTSWRVVGSVLGAWIVVQAAGVWSVLPPAPVAAGADAGVVSAERAFARLSSVARSAHPVGSEAGRELREALQDALVGLGLQVEQQTGQVVERPGMPLVNVVARRRGTGDGGALLLLAHHDSVARGEGAGDDGAGVAAILEALAATRDDPPVRHDVIVLFSDGEEAGLLGARLFEREHPWRADVLAVVNVEGRGNAGPSTLFELGPGSGALLRAYAAATPSAFGDALGPAVYARMPNDTDFSVFRDAGLPGLNFAFFAGASVYHRATDTWDALSTRALQHHAENVLGVLRGTASLDLRAAREPAPAFTVVPGLGMVVLPRALTTPLLVVGAAWWFLRVARGCAAGRLRVVGVAGGAFVEVLALPLAVGAAWLVGLGALAGAAALVPTGVDTGNVTSALLLCLGAAGLGLSLRLGASLGARRVGLRAAEAGEGGLLPLLILGGAASVGLPAGATHPAALLLLGGMAAAVVSGGAARGQRLAVSALPGFAGLLFVLPLQHLLGWVGSVVPLGPVVLGGALAGVAGMALGPAREAAPARLVSRLSLCLLLLGVALLVSAALLSVRGG